jgi:hypothetical protein
VASTSISSPPSSRFFPFVDAALGMAAPVLLFLLGAGMDVAIGFAFAAVNPVASSSTCFLFLGMLTLGILLVSRKKTRPFGWGVLAGAFIFPIWTQNACSIQYYR